MSQYISPAQSQEWGTPQWLFDQLNAEFNFSLDACATESIAKCQRFFSVQEDALMQKWAPSTFCNPPYGVSLKKWVHKAYGEAARGCTVVMLLPVRSDTDWFHRYCLAPGTEIRFIKGRISFTGNKSRSRAPFPSMVVIFRPPDMTKSIDARTNWIVY